MRNFLLKYLKQSPTTNIRLVAKTNIPGASVLYDVMFHDSGLWEPSAIWGQVRPETRCQTLGPGTWDRLLELVMS